MPDIYAFGFALQPTSAAMITTTGDIFNQDGIRQSTPTSATIVATNPTFAGVQSATAQLNGSILASWNAASGPNGPYVYDVYVQESTATGLFNPANWMQTDSDTQTYVWEYTGNNILRAGFTYYVGVKARDPLGNISLSTASVFAVSTGVQPSRALSPADIPSVVAAVWGELQAGYTGAGTFGRFLDDRVSTKASQTSVNGIPTNPLLVTDSRLNTLDANISSRSNQTSVDNINTKIGTPAGSVSSDIADVKADTAGVKTKTDAIQLDGANYVRSRTMVNEDKTDYELTAGERAAGADAVWDEAKAGHVTAGSFGESNQGVVSVSRANNLDNLDTSITSRASQASVSAIQNNTDFVGIVPTTLLLPATGSKTYPLYVRLFDSSNSPVDPDLDEMSMTIKDSAGATVQASMLMTKTGVGQYEATYTVASTDPERSLFVFFDYDRAAVSFNQVRATEVQEFESKLDTVLSRLTPARADNLDNLDTTISSRASQISVNTVGANVLTRASQASVDAIPTAAEIADAVLDEDVNAHATGTSLARTVKDAKIFSQIDL